jgi:hypothetical protein
MVRVRTAASHGIRAIICLGFAGGEHHPADLNRLRRSLVDHPCTLHAVDCSGAFDMMIEAGCEDLLHYQTFLDNVRSAGEGIISELRHCLICRRYVRDRDSEEWIWLPVADGRRRLPLRMIDKLCAEGDYVRVHAGEKSWLLHMTMCAIERQLPPDSFVRLHRSLIVRQDRIVKLVHDDHGWGVELDDGSVHRVPRARSNAVRNRLGVESSTLSAISSSLA